MWPHWAASHGVQVKTFLIHLIPALQGRLNLLKYSPRDVSAPI